MTPHAARKPFQDGQRTPGSSGEQIGSSADRERSTVTLATLIGSRGRHPKDEKQAEATNPASAGASGVTVASITYGRPGSNIWKHIYPARAAAKKAINGYRDHVERIFAEWLDTALRELATDPARVAKKHDEVTRENGPYTANGSMRTLRAIYNHARKTNKLLPSDTVWGET
jgi:hypothetical protein